MGNLTTAVYEGAGLLTAADMNMQFRARRREDFAASLEEFSRAILAIHGDRREPVSSDLAPTPSRRAISLGGL